MDIAYQFVKMQSHHALQHLCPGIIRRFESDAAGLADRVLSDLTGEF
jgi:hypothetical protein